MSKTRDNHYVPQWHQKGFFFDGKEKICYLGLIPQIYPAKTGGVKEVYSKKWYHPSQCFYKTDLYTTFFGSEINDEIERVLFGKIDDIGSIAVRAFIDGDLLKQHHHYENFFTYLDAQKTRTPKGLDWVKKHYPDLNQLDLMMEMQLLHTLHCTLWAEGVIEIVNAKTSSVKFIVSDHPITVYNYACPPDSLQCQYPNDPDIALKASQTIYPLDQNNALILTNLEYAKDPDGIDPLAPRTHSKKMRKSMIRTDAVIRSRSLEAGDVEKINYIIKKRAKSYIAAGDDAWLYPESNIHSDWKDLREVLMPPSDQMFLFGGEIYVGYEDGSTSYQDEFGRKNPENDFLKKNIGAIERNDLCGCGSGNKYKKCCMNIPVEQRTSWKYLSVRERNILLYDAIYGILGLDEEKSWVDIQRELNNEQVRDIYAVYGALWPSETDIYQLLPRPDNKLRGLYSGFLDPRVMDAPLNLAPYFDEILIQHPFVNPNNVKPEFSPVEFPSKYKYQALKDVLFLIELEPFVRSGRIQLIPDLCDFSLHLHRDVLNISEQQRGETVVSQRDQTVSSKLNQEDIFHTTLIKPDVLEKRIRKQNPEFSDGQVLELKEFFSSNPLSLLQNVDISGGQFIATSMSPNSSMSLFLAQITGSIVVTDSETRWGQFQRAQSREQGIVIYPWEKFSSAFSEIVWYMKTDIILGNLSSADFVQLRAALSELKNSVRDNIQDVGIIQKIEQRVIVPLRKITDEVESPSAIAQVHALMPKGGFVDNNVLRLLLQSNCENYLKSVPMVMYFDFTEDDLNT